MRLLIGFALALTVACVVACDSGTGSRKASAPPKETAETTSEQKQAVASGGDATKPSPPMAYSRVESRGGGGAGGGLNSVAEPQLARAAVSHDARDVSLASISTVYAATEAIDRKIIRNADLTLETESPTDGLRKITVAAEAHGGFVVTSEFKQNPVAAGARPTQNVTVVARVPASQFASALEQIRNAGERVVQEKISGQDVSEEYLDVEARLRNKRALEAQFIDIMKQARKVQDALDVQNELAEVRTEIERLEGRRRFLENQSALSTITTMLQMPQPIIAATTSGFGATIKRTFGDAVDTAASIVLFVIQAVIVLVPIAIFFGLPLWVVWRVLRRRISLRRQPEPSPIPSE